MLSPQCCYYMGHIDMTTRDQHVVPDIRTCIDTGLHMENLYKHRNCLFQLDSLLLRNLTRSNEVKFDMGHGA